MAIAITTHNNRAAMPEQKGSRFDFDGGHAMLFHRLDGQRMISLHAPNQAPNERPFFYEY